MSFHSMDLDADPQPLLVKCVWVCENILVVAEPSQDMQTGVLKSYIPARERPGLKPVAAYEEHF